MIEHTLHRKIAHAALSIIAFLMLTLPAPALALEETDLPLLDQFVQDLINGDPGDLRGLYVPDVLADAIVKQPEEMPAYVSSEPGELTRFQMAEDQGTFGLLAHNYLAGESFFALEKGQAIYLVYGDGQIEKYVVRYFLRYQAVSPQSVTSDFIDLETRELFSASELFMKVFNRPGDVVLQTCINTDGESSWGRLFIIAVPEGDYDPRSIPSFHWFD